MAADNSIADATFREVRHSAFIGGGMPMGVRSQGRKLDQAAPLAHRAESGLWIVMTIAHGLPAGATCKESRLRAHRAQGKRGHVGPAKALTAS